MVKRPLDQLLQPKHQLLAPRKAVQTRPGRPGSTRFFAQVRRGLAWRRKSCQRRDRRRTVGASGERNVGASGERNLSAPSDGHDAHAAQRSAAAVRAAQPRRHGDEPPWRRSAAGRREQRRARAGARPHVRAWCAAACTRATRAPDCGCACGGRSLLSPLRSPGRTDDRPEGAADDGRAGPLRGRARRRCVPRRRLRAAVRAISP